MIFNNLLRPVAAFLIAVGLLAAAPAADAAEKGKTRLVLHVDDNDPARMNLALNNATNVLDYYREKGQLAEVEIVAYGPGLHMLRADTSPVKDRIASLKKSMDGLEFIACANTQARMAKAENKKIPIVPEGKMTPSGVVHLIERQQEGWAYVRP